MPVVSGRHVMFHATIVGLAHGGSNGAPRPKLNDTYHRHQLARTTRQSFGALRLVTVTPKHDKSPEATYSRQKTAHWPKQNSPGGQFLEPAVDDVDR